MANNKIILGNETLMDITPTTAVESDVAEGKVFFKADGSQAEGTKEEPTYQSKSVTITENGSQTVSPDSGYDALSSVAVTTNVQPATQTKSVTYTENGSYTVNKDSGYDGMTSVGVTVNVPQPSGSKSITTNGTHDVEDYAEAVVNVQPTVQSKAVSYTANGSATVTADSGYDGLSSVAVTVSIPTYDGSVS